MREQAERPIGRGGELRVVVVERVRASRVGKRRMRRRAGERFAAEHGRFFRAGRLLSVLTEDVAAFSRRAGEEHAEVVDETALSFGHDVGGHVAKRRRGDEALDRVGRAFDRVAANFLLRFRGRSGLRSGGNGTNDRYGRDFEKFFTVQSHTQPRALG